MQPLISCLLPLSILPRMRIEVQTGRTLRCPCGGEIREPLPPNCPHCGAKIRGVRRKANWLGPAIILLLFAGLCAALYLLTAGK